MPQEPINAEVSLEEQLVAYLDGELDSESCRRIEERLAADPQVRAKLNWMEQTWEVLDELEASPVDEDFTRTTLEMVAIAAEEDLRINRETAPLRRRRLWFFGGLGLIVAGLAGFMAVSIPAMRLNHQLLQDLPVLENLDEYQQIKDIQFLRLLKEHGLFVKDGDALSRLPVISDKKEDLVAHINSLSPGQKSDLLRKYERFARMTPTEKTKYRELHNEIEQDPQAEELRGVMQRYFEWYKLIPSSYDRSEFTALPAEERIGWIEEHLKDEQNRITRKPPLGKDTDTLWVWLETYAEKHEKSLMDSLPMPLRERLAAINPDARHQAVMWMIWHRPQSTTYRPTESDVADLLPRLTPHTQKLLEGRSPGEQIRIVQNWGHNLVAQLSFDVSELVDDQVLAEFFEKNLTGPERERLMNLSAEDMQRELLRQYIIQNRQRDGGGK